MEYVSFKAIIAKNVPKHFFNIFTFNFKDILAPIIAPNIPNNDINTPNFILMFLFFKFTIIATIEVGIKNIKFVACAICCSNPQIDVKRNIS